MNKRNSAPAWLGLSLLCAACLAAQADDTVTFQVDLTRYTNSLGQQAATLVDVRGAFNSWSAGWTLNNNGANVYTNTFVVAGTTGDKLQYKFTYGTCTGTTWEDDNPPPGSGQPPDEGNNRVLQLIGGAQPLPSVPFYAPSVSVPISLVSVAVTYQVDMTAQIQNGFWTPGQPIRVTGAQGVFNWGDGMDLTNNPALSGDATNVYSQITNICGTIGGSGGQYKFRANGGWEDCSLNGPNYDGGNRVFTITDTSMVLPLVYYEDRPPGQSTNVDLTLSIDLTAEVLTGGFTNGLSAIRVSGRFNGWGDGDLLTNNPALPGTASNKYSTTISYTDTVGNWQRYKFRLNGGWETANVYGVGNNKDRIVYTVGGEQILPMVTYSDSSVCDLLLQQTMVTFRCHITNGTVATDGHAFAKGVDKVYINGLGAIGRWAAWNDPFDPIPEMTNNPVGSDYYEITLPATAGSSRQRQFKLSVGYSLGVDSGPDNENAMFNDHYVYVRSYGPSFTMPVVEFGTNFTSSLVEQQFGNLSAGAPSGGNIPITWLGYPCVTLQNSSSVSGGVWNDNPATDNQSSTNWPNTGSQQFFQLFKRLNP